MNPLKKRQKLDDEQLETYCKELDDLQDKLDVIDKEERDKVIQLSVEYNKQRKPHFDKRNELVSKIPDFWLTAVSYFPVGIVLLRNNGLFFPSLNTTLFSAVCSRRKMKRFSSIFPQWRLLKRMMSSPDTRLLWCVPTVKLLTQTAN